MMFITLALKVKCFNIKYFLLPQFNVQLQVNHLYTDFPKTLVCEQGEWPEILTIAQPMP